MQNWTKLSKTEKNWEKLGKTGENLWKLEKTGEIWEKSNLKQFWRVWSNFDEFRRVSPSFAQFCPVLPSFAQFCPVLPSFSRDPTVWRDRKVSLQFIYYKFRRISVVLTGGMPKKNNNMPRIWLLYFRELSKTYWNLVTKFVKICLKKCML